MLQSIRDCRHEQFLVGRGTIDEPLGMVVKQELLDQALDGQKLDPLAVIRAPRIVPETTPVFRVLGHFKQNPIRLAAVLDEYGTLQGIVTQTDLLEAIAGELPDVEAGEPDIVEHDDGSLPIDGLMPAHDAFDGLGIRVQPDRGFHTIAGFALMQLAHLQEAEEKPRKPSLTRAGVSRSSTWLVPASINCSLEGSRARERLAAS